MKRTYLILVSCICSIYLLHAQNGKVYFQASPTNQTPAEFSAEVLAPIPGGSSFYLAGSLKEESPSLTARGYILRLDRFLQKQLTSALVVPSMHSYETLNFGGAAVDKQQNLFLAGALMQNPQGGTFNSERFVAAIDPVGKVDWAGMQANYRYEDVTIEANSQHIIAVAGPDGYTPQANISLQRYDPTGQLLRYIELATSTEDRAIKVISVPNSDDFLIVGQADTGNNAKPLVARFDQDFTLQWAHVFELTGLRSSVIDAAWHPEGLIGITGNVLGNGNPAQTYLLQISPDGEPLGVHTFMNTGGRSLQATSVSMMHIPQGKSGFVVGGTHIDPLVPNEGRAFAYFADLNGVVQWAWNYSYIPPKEYRVNETAEQVAYVEGSDALLLAGNYQEFLPGLPAADRRIWAARVLAETGELTNQISNGCSEGMEVVAQNASSSYITVGSTVPGGSATSIGFNTDNPVFHSGFCSYSDATKPQVGILSDANVFVLSPKGLRVSYEPGSVDQAELIDIQGRSVRQVSLAKGTSEMTWALPGLSRGVYILRLSNRGIPLTHKKVTVQP